MTSDHDRGDDLDRLARWLLDNVPDDCHGGSAVDVAIRLIGAARGVYPPARLAVQAAGAMLDGWGDGDEARRRYLWTDLHTRVDDLAEALERAEQRWDVPASPNTRYVAAWRGIDPGRPATPDPAAPVEVSPAIELDMKRIAALHPAVEYDPHDRPEEVAAVLAAAKAAGLVPVPSDTITPRTYRGAALPAYPGATQHAADVDPVAVRPVLVDAALRELTRELTAAATPILERLVLAAAAPAEVPR